MNEAGSRPTYRHALPYSQTWAGNAERFCRDKLGIILDAWQSGVLSDWMARDPSAGAYAHYRNGLEVPRQNGKTALLEVRISYGAAVKGERILYTAHDGSTVTQLIDRMKYFFGEKANDPKANFPEMNRAVRRMRWVNGKEAILLKNGGAIYFSTRTKSSKRGYTVDVVVADEAQALEEMHLKAMLSTASAAPNGDPQIYLIGTPPGPEYPASVFSSVRESVLDGTDASDISWNEWSVDEVGDVRDESRWFRTNPALGTRITIAAVRGELGTYGDPMSFAQERLGYWLPKARLRTVIDSDDWDACVTGSPPTGCTLENPPTGGQVLAFGVKIAPDDSFGAIAACIRPRDGVPYVELVRHFALDGGIREHVSWLADRARIAAHVHIDGKGTAQALCEAVAASSPRGYAELLPTAKAVEAYGMFLNAVRDGAVAHSGAEALRKSAVESAKRTIGRDGGFGFAATEGADSTPVEAAALAYRAAMTAKRNPQRKARVSF